MQSNYVYLPISLNSELAAYLLKSSRIQGKSLNFVVTDILQDHLHQNPIGNDFEIAALNRIKSQNLSLRLEIGKKIAFLRQAHCLSQKDLGYLLGLDRKIISNIECGIRRIDVLELLAISRVFNIDISFLINND